MADPDLRLRTLRRATQLFRETPGRMGRLVEIDDAADLLVAGDLHGNLENFRRLLLRANLTGNPKRHFVIQELIHGPYSYPEGGDKSHQLVDLAAALKCQFPGRVHYLLGNHELAQATGRRIAKTEGDLIHLFRQGVNAAYGLRAAEIHDAYIELFAAIPLALRTANRVFLSHSLPSAGHLPEFDPAVLWRETTPGDVGPGGAVYSLVWGRDTRPETAAAFLHLVDADWLVTGHIPCDRGYDVPNDRQIVLDCICEPGTYLQFPTNRSLTLAALIEGVAFLGPVPSTTT
jgi:hypothetical protein